MTVQRRKDNKGRVLRKGEYQRKDNSYMYVFKGELGKKNTIYAPTLKELREKEEEVARDLMDGIKPDASRVTINQMYERWKQLREMDVKGGTLRDNTFRNYCYMVEQFVVPDFGNTKIKDATPAKFEAFYKFLISERGLKVLSVDGVHVPLKQVMQLAVDSNYIRQNPAEGIMRKIKIAYKKKEAGLSSQERALTIEQQQLFLDYLEGSETFNRWHSLFVVMLFTGMRVGELTGLRWCDIDEENDTLTVNHTLVHYSKGKGREVKYAINDTKTPAGFRLIPMLPMVKEAIANERNRQEAEGIKSRMVIDGYSGFVFVNRFGDCLNQGTINKALRRIIRDCNLEQLNKGSEVLLPPFSCHWLRHTFATRLVESQVNVKAAQGLLGHADARTTLNIYAAAQEDFKRSEIEKLTNNRTNDLQTFE